ncbi:MAG: N-acetylmuramoyl-L-alanine amidase [Myxococcaceae bacterium]
MPVAFAPTVSRLLALALFVLSVSPVRAANVDASEQAYQQARHAYYVLKGDAGRRRYRDSWLGVAHKFEAVAQKYPASTRAPDALFTAAGLLAELSRISQVPEDLSGAVDDYKKLLERHPRHKLADDSALALARLQLDRLGQVEVARATLQHALTQLPKGDQYSSLRTLLASLPAETPKKPPAPVVRRPAPKAVRDFPALSKAATPAPPSAAAVEPTAVNKPPVASPPTLAAAEAPAAEGVAEAPALPPGPSVRERMKSLGRQTGGEVTLAEQLGLKIRRVVIDAGHGGHDTGTVGPGGTQEKTVALGIALRLGQVLTDEGLEVVFTREDDHFVRLEDRARLANEAHGDLFISIHCNSGAEASWRGVETYTLNLTADRYAIRLAARENTSSAKTMSDLQFLLADLATRAHTDESGRLAERVQHSMVARMSLKYPKVKDRGRKEALFYVLLGAKMPAILVETGFLSNPEDEKRLANAGYEDEVARSIAAGVQDFLGYRERLAKVDTR